MAMDFGSLGQLYAARNRATAQQLDQAAQAPVAFDQGDLREIAQRMRGAGLDEDVIRAGFERRGLDYGMVERQSLPGVFGRAAWQAGVPGTLRAGAGAYEMAAGPDATFDDTLREVASSAEALVEQPDAPRSLGEAAESGEWGRYGAQAVGSGIGSTGASLAAAAAGTLTAGPVGGLAAAGMASFVQNAGAVYNDLRDRGVEHNKAAATSGLTGIPMAALDVAGLRFMPGVGRIVGRQGAPIAGGVVRRAAVGSGRGMAAEGLTEAAQQTFQEAATSRVDPDYDIGQGATNILESLAVGGLTGGSLGAVGGQFAARPPESLGDMAEPDDDSVFRAGAPEPVPMLPPPTNLEALRDIAATTTDPQERAEAVRRYREGVAARQAQDPDTEPPAPASAEPSLADAYSALRRERDPMRRAAGLASFLDRASRTATTDAELRQRRRAPGQMDLDDRAADLPALPAPSSDARRLSRLRRAVQAERDPTRRAALVDALRAAQRVQSEAAAEMPEPRRSVEERYAAPEQQREAEPAVEAPTPAVTEEAAAAEKAAGVAAQAFEPVESVDAPNRPDAQSSAQGAPQDLPVVQAEDRPESDSLAPPIETNAAVSPDLREPDMELRVRPEQGVGEQGAFTGSPSDVAPQQQPAAPPTAQAELAQGEAQAAAEEDYIDLPEGAPPAWEDAPAFAEYSGDSEYVPPDIPGFEDSEPDDAVYERMADFNRRQRDRTNSSRQHYRDAWEEASKREAERMRAAGVDSAELSSKPATKDDSGNWRATDSGFVLADNGGVLSFKSQLTAAKWIVGVGQADGSRQSFEIENHPTARGWYSVREREALNASESATKSPSPAPPAASAPKPRAKRGYSPPKRARFNHWIAITGGITESDANDQNQYFPGVGSLIRKKARTLDGKTRDAEMVLESAIEAGYLWDGASTDDLLSEMRRDAGGSGVYARGDAEAVQAEREQSESEDRIADKILEMETDLGPRLADFDLSDAEKRTVAEIMLNEQMGAEDALDAFVERDALANDADFADTADDGDGFDIPFATDAGAAEQAARPAGGARPEAKQPVGRAAGTGQDGAGEARGAGPGAEPGAEGRPQLVIPGAERSAKQAQAARDAGRGKGSKAPQQKADEGLFRPPEDDRQAKFQRRPESIRFTRQVDDFLAGKLEGRALIRMGPVPPVLQSVGMKAREMWISQRVLAKALQEKHGADVDPEVVRRLPDLIADPIMVLRGEKANTYVVALEAKDRSGDTVIAPVIEVTLDGGGLRADVASVFGKDQASWFDGQIRAGRLLYVDRGRATRWVRAVDDQFVKAAPTSGRKVLVREDVFKGRDRRGDAPTAPSRPAVLKELRDLIRRIAGSRVRVDLAGAGELLDPDGQPVEGRYLRGIITVALDAADAAGTARHEAIHFLREVGAIPAGAWRTLEARAPQWRAQFNIDTRYPDLTEAELIEEAIAEAYMAWGAGKLPKPGPVISGVFGRIRQIMQAIRDAVRKLWGGTQPSAEDVFKAIERGEMAGAADAASTPEGDSEAQYRRPGTAASTRPSFIAAPEAGPVQRIVEGLTSAAGRSWWRDKALPHLAQQYVNRLDPIKRAEMRRFGKVQDAQRSAFKLAEMAAQDTGRFEMMVKHGPLLWDATAGVVRVDTATGGLRDVFGQIESRADYDAFQGYAYAKRAQRLAQEGRERLMSPRQITAALAVPAAAKARYDAMLDRWQRYNGKMLDFLVDTGTIKATSRDIYASTMDYVPFYRVLEDSGELLGPNALRAGLSNPDPRIRKLLGGTEKLGDLFDNISRNARALATAGLRNVAMTRTHDLLATLNEMDDIPAHQTKGDDAVSYFVAGQKRWFRPHDPAMFHALAPMPAEKLGALYEAMKGLAGIFRAGITLSPSFMIANALRGFAAGFVQTGQNVSMRYNTLTGFANALRDSPSIQAMKTATGTGGYRFGPEAPALSGDALRRAVGADPQSLWGIAQKALDRLEHIGEATELAERDAIYNNLRAKGVSEAEAAYQAMNLINFSRGGMSKSLRFLIPLVPFLNARIQGLYRMFETGGDRSVLPGILLRGSLLMAAAVGLWGLNNADEEDRERYAAEPIERRMSYFIIYGPGDNKILIPKPFEFGALFATLPEFLMDAMTKENGWADLGTVAAATLLNTFAFNPIPAAVLPAVEVATNYDMFRGRPLESLSQQRMEPEARADAFTSSTAKAIGQVTGPLAGLSPIEVQHLIEGYLGMFGAALMAASDSVAGAAGLMPARPTGALGSVPVIGSAIESALGRFYRDGEDSANRWVGDLYDLKREADQIYATARMHRASGEIAEAKELMTDNRALLAQRKALDAAADDMADLTRRMNRIRADGELSGADMKAKLDPLIRRRNEIAARVARRATARIDGAA